MKPIEIDALTKADLNIDEYTFSVTVPSGVTEPFPDLTPRDWRSQAETFAAAGLESLYVFPLGPDYQLEVYCDQGIPETAQVENTRSLEAIVEELCYDDLDRHQALAMWGFDPDLSPAAEDYSGPCRVWHEPHYLEGTYNVPGAGYAADEDGCPCEFETYAAAAAYVTEYYTEPSQYDGVPACNVLSYGQTGADTLIIVPA